MTNYLKGSIHLKVMSATIVQKSCRMEQRDLDLIALWQDKDPELKKLWTEHLEYEEQLEQFNKRVYLSPAEELERKTLQKKKLKGRDQIERILMKLRSKSTQ